VAWVVYDKQVARKYEGVDYNWHNKEFRIFEKKNDQWKIIFQHSGRLMYPEPLQAEMDINNVVFTENQS
jgi:hypothetical protein